MPWVAPTTQPALLFVTAAIWNTLVNAILFLKGAFDDAGNFAPSSSTLTLASAAAAPTLNRHKVDTQAAAVTDNLNTLTISGSTRDGHQLTLSAFNVGRVVTVRNGLGNIVLRGGDYALNAADKFIKLNLVGTTWYETARSAPRGELNTTAVSSTYTVVDIDDVVLASGTFTVTLPTAVGRKRPYVIKNNSTGVITVGTTGGQTIDGVTSFTLPVQYQSITFLPDGAGNWVII